MAGPMASAPAMLRTAAAIGLIALAIGLLTQYLFVDVAFGINVPIATAALLAAGWLVRDLARPAPRLLDAWLAPGALILATFVALRGDGTLVALDTLGALVLSGAALLSFGGLRVLERPFAAILRLGTQLAVSGFVAGVRPLRALAAALPSVGGRSRTGRFAPVLRGLLIAVPLVILFVALFSAADAVFAQITEDLFDWDLDLESVPGRFVVAAFAGWLAAGLLAFVARGEEDAPPTAAGVRERGPRLGSAEAVTVLVVLDLLFAGFVVLQGTYLFGGRDTLEASGLTYAEYARRGFFELLAVAFVVGGLILAAERFVRDRSRVYVVAAVVLVAMTIVILASAFLRLRLYQDAYGWTELRFYVLAAILWLALGALMAIVTLATDRSRWLLHGMLVLSFGFGLAFNVIGPLKLIAEENIGRAIHPERVAPGGETGLDTYYLAYLGDDALAVVAENLCALPPSLQPRATEAVSIWTDEVAHDEAGKAWQAWNLSRERARDVRIPESCGPSDD